MSDSSSTGLTSTGTPLDTAIQTITSATEPVHTPVPEGPLLREVWPMPPDAPRVTHLVLYQAGIGWDDSDTIVRIDLASLQTQQIAVLPGERYTPSTRLAPLGSLIATTMNQNDGWATLALWRPDGSREQLAYPVRIENLPSCEQAFLWAPQTQRLVYRTFRFDQPNNDQIFVYDATRTDRSQLLLDQPGKVQILGWTTPNQLILAIYDQVPEQHPPVQRTSIQALETSTKTLTPLGQLPLGQVFCPRLSPNGQRLLFSMDSGRQTYLLDLPTQRLVPVYAPDDALFWAPDGQSILVNSTLPGRRMRLLDARNGETRHWLNIAPPLPDSHEFLVHAASPDGHALVGCAWNRNSGPYGGDTSTWLYNVSEDRWSRLAGGRWCAAVSGWEIQP